MPKRKVRTRDRPLSDWTWSIAVTTRAARAAADCFVDNGASGTPCWICGRPLNYGLPKKHRLAAVAYLTGGDPTEPSDLAPAHRECNDKATQRNSR